LKAAKAIEKEAKKKEHATNVYAHLMDLSNFAEVNEEEKDGASKTLFDKEAGSNSPVQKKKRNIGALKSNQRYTKSMASKKIVTLQQNTQFINFGVTLTTNDKSGKFLVKVKDLLMNLQLLDKTAGLVELLPRNKSSPTIISQEIDIPSNFTPLGRFIVFSGDGIFKVQKKYNSNNEKQTKHRDNNEEKIFSNACYGTACITSIMESAQLISGVVNEWESKGGLKLVIKEFQAPGSKLVAVIYNVSNLTPMPAVKGALQFILCKTKEEEALEANDAWMNKDNVDVTSMGFTLKLQVPKKFKINTKEVENMPREIKQFRQAFHIKVALKRR
jgi:hypothetical protein